jgi:glycerol-3-phosphate acyltransferase PlsX
MDRIHVEHTGDVVGANEKPLQALRRKGNTSIGRVAALVREGEAEAMVSAGNTGATVASAIFSLKLLEGVRRAGIATFLPTIRGRATVIDVGANVKCRPEHLLQYGIMAGEYVRLILGQEEPTIGLLNIGQEDEKGNELVKETRQMFADADVNFRGNLEGHDVFMGQTDVVVCEGFVGNVVLKTAEGLAVCLIQLLGRTYVEEEGLEGEKLQVIGKSLEWLRRRTDYEEYGGAPLLGVNGVCVIGHGRSDWRAVVNAIRAAARISGLHVNRHMVEELSRVCSEKC